MSYLKPEGGGFVLHDADNKPRKLLEFVRPADNRSDLIHVLFLQEINAALPKIFNNTPEAAINAIIFLRVVQNLLRKPQIHAALKFGQWSPLNEALAEILPKFNEKNSLSCYVPHRPIGKFNHVNFIFAEVNGGGANENSFLPENRFDTIIYDKFEQPPLEVMLAARDYGKIYFSAPPAKLENFLREHAQTFELEKFFAVVELEVAPPLKRELRRRTPQGQLDAKKFQVIQTVSKLQEVAQKFNAHPQQADSYLDEYIAEVTRAEKILAEIFPALHSDTIKFNFSRFKELLIDVRLYRDLHLKQIAVTELNQQTGVLIRDINQM